MIYFFTLAVPLIIVYLITPDIRYFALKTSAIDKKNHRKVHKKVIAQLGGLAIYFGMLGGLAIIGVLDPEYFKAHVSQIAGFIICSTLMMMLGVYDDLQGSGALTKFAVQIVIALLLTRIGFRLENIHIPHLIDMNLGILSTPLTIFWLVGITNAFNLIDGLDGLATGLVAIMLVFFCVFGIFIKENFFVYISLALIGASCAFLRYNFYPAKIFLGDTGSLFLGFTIGCLAIYRTGAGVISNVFFVPALILAFLPILDTALAIIRRIIRKQFIFSGDASHIHHYYIKQGFSQVQVVIGFYCITFCLGVISFLVYNNSLSYK